MAAQIDTIVRDVSVISPKRDEVSTPAEQNAFVVSAETTYDEIALQLVSDLNDFKDEANILSTEVSANATSAESDALIAQSVVNSKGAWSGLTGSLDVNNSVTHTGSVWVVNVLIPDVTLSEPTDVNTDWTEVSGVTQAELDLKEDIVDNDAKLALKANLSGANFTGLVGLKKSADIASATVLPIPVDGNYADVTGITTVTSIATTANVGTVIKYHFNGILTLTHHATNLILPSGANITTAAGDEAEFIEYASGDFRCTSYTKADGEAVVTLEIASTAEAQAGTDDTKAISPLKMREGFNASGSAPVYANRAWVNFNGTGTVAIRASGNVSSITDNGVGDYTVNFLISLEDTNYAPTFGGKNPNNTNNAYNMFIGIHPLDVGSVNSLRLRATATVLVSSASPELSSSIDADIVAVNIIR